jgi:hypothetical protein
MAKFKIIQFLNKRIPESWTDPRPKVKPKLFLNKFEVRGSGSAKFTKNQFTEVDKRLLVKQSSDSSSAQSNMCQMTFG